MKQEHIDQLEQAADLAWRTKDILVKFSQAAWVLGFNELQIALDDAANRMRRVYKIIVQVVEENQ